MYDPIRALRVLQAHDVRHVVIGGYAASLLGTQIMTADLDVCYERTTDNMKRLAGALNELHARLRVAGVDEDLPFVVDHLSLAAGDSFTFSTDAGDLDVLGTPSGSGGFRDLDADATTYQLGDDLLVRVVSLDDLIRMKEAAGRPKDQAHLHVLSDLRAALREADHPPNA